MDLSKNLVLKENYTFLVADSDGQIDGAERGLYNRDTRFLNLYRWDFGDTFQTLITHSHRPDHVIIHYASIEESYQTMGIRRHIKLSSGEMKDTLTVENTSFESTKVSLALYIGADFADMFEARGFHRIERTIKEPEIFPEGLKLYYAAMDGLVFSVKIDFSVRPEKIEGGRVQFDYLLKSKERFTIECTVKIDNPLERPAKPIDYNRWRECFPLHPEDTPYRDVLERAVNDLRALLLFTEYGPFPAAGIPWFVAAFGRDSLLTAYMLLPWGVETARGVLRYLASYQGKKIESFHEEAPGKIMHELRFGELSRSGRIPHSPYYGTIDATPLFVILTYQTWRSTGDDMLLSELSPNWEAALQWIKEYGDMDGDGFLEYNSAEPGKGLTVQSWKDSGDSMSHADGSLARGPIAPCEVQGYAYAAFKAAAEFYLKLGEADKAARWEKEAVKLAERFHRYFWIEEYDIYAMALDGAKRPLKVLNSNAGQLLWTGIVPEEIAPRVVRSLFSERLWSGWGIRTLGEGEARYNPVSYHNGSVWPHDNALIAGGLARYGFKKEAYMIRDALFALAGSQPDKRLPELIAGYPRSEGPPVPYPVACRPQAWDAAALLYLLRL
ncbi:MAG: amylo-alpha-1,6-glucosidase [Spirochaetes bacterium]|nr:MAG: amylo-alpha-1,6-glucosidase [Spirochaetota bacterium]